MQRGFTISDEGTIRIEHQILAPDHGAQGSGLELEGYFAAISVQDADAPTDEYFTFYVSGV